MEQTMRRSSIQRCSFLATVALALAACGGEDPGTATPTPTPTPWANRAPSLHVASPSALAVGEDLTLLGKDLIGAEHGQLMIVFRGTYFDAEGGTHPVDLQQKAVRDRTRPDKVTWKLWPNIVFHKTGDGLGYFLGDITVVNQANDGTQLPSAPLAAKLEVKPSLLPRMARPVSSDCQSLVSETLEDTGFVFTVEAIGLRAATKDNPITFYWTFLAEQWKVGITYGVTDPSSLLPKTGAFMFEDQVTGGTSSSVQDGGSRSFLLKVGSDVIGDGRIKELRTGKVPDAGNNFATTVNVAAVDSSGKSVKLSIPILVGRMADLVYDGSTRIAERHAPTQVSDCIPGGDIGRQVTYSEDKAESRSRSMGFSYNASAGINIAPFPANPWLLGINFSMGFGVEVGASVSTNKSSGLNISGQILPGQYGTFYRQTTKVQRVGKIVGRNKCGQTVDLGEAILTDWLFTPDLATGPACTPPTKLPPAQVFE
jgi:hypothetical protein